MRVLELKELPTLNTTPPTIIIPPSDIGKSSFNQTEGNTILIDELHHVVPTKRMFTEKKKED